MAVKQGRKLTASQRLWAERERFIPKGLAHYHPIFAESASGASLTDVDGNAYIDFAGGIGALNVGHCHPRVVEALRRQAGKLLHAAAQVTPYESYIEVCRRLVEAAPGSGAKKAVLFSTGAEAVENAVKLARAFTKRRGVLSFESSFHGRTYLAVSLTGKHKPFRRGIGPFPGDIYHIPYPYPYRPPRGVRPEDLTAFVLERMEALFSATVAADELACIIVEPVQGEGGFVVPPADFLPALRKLCDKHGILLIADEVQSGFGRTGRMFAVEHSRVVPDLMVVAKSLAAGLPLSGVVGRADIMDSLDPGGLGGTYAGNPLACAAAVAVFEAFEKDKLLARAVRVGGVVEARFDRLARRVSCVGESRGQGAMRALELVRDRATKEPLAEADMKKILAAAADEGLLLIKAGAFGNVLRCLVPLTIQDAELEKGLDILDNVLKNFKPS